MASELTLRATMVRFVEFAIFEKRRSKFACRAKRCGPKADSSFWSNRDSNHADSNQSVNFNFRRLFIAASPIAARFRDSGALARLKPFPTGLQSHLQSVSGCRRRSATFRAPIARCASQASMSLTERNSSAGLPTPLRRAGAPAPPFARQPPRRGTSTLQVPAQDAQ